MHYFSRFTPDSHLNRLWTDRGIKKQDVTRNNRGCHELGNEVIFSLFIATADAEPDGVSFCFNFAYVFKLAFKKAPVAMSNVMHF